MNDRQGRGQGRGQGGAIAPGPLSSDLVLKRGVAARVRTRGHGDFELPLPPTLANTLPVLLEDAASGIVVSASDLADESTCLAFSVVQRRRLALTLRRAVEAQLLPAQAEQAPANGWARLVVNWQPHAVGLFPLRAQARLRLAAELQEPARIALADFVARYIRRFEEAVPTLMLCEPPTWESDDWVRVEVGRGGLLRRRRLPVSAIQIEAPQKWRPDLLRSRRFNVPGGGFITEMDPRFGWWVHNLLLHAQVPKAGQDDDVRVLFDAARESGLPRLQVIGAALQEALERAAAMSVGEEIADVAHWVGRASRDRVKAAAVVRMRYGCDGEVRSMAELGAHFGQTRQFMNDTLRRCAALCAQGGYTPALDKLMQAIGRSGGGPASVIADRLRPLLGDRQSLQGALMFAQDFFAKKGPSLMRAKVSGSTAEVDIVVLEGATGHDALLRVVNERLRAVGYCHWTEALAMAGSAAGGPHTREALDEAVQRQPGLAWASPAREWVLWASRESALAQQLRRMLVEAFPGGLGLDEIVGGLRRWLDARPATTVMPRAADLEALALCVAPAVALHWDGQELRADELSSQEQSEQGLPQGTDTVPAVAQLDGDTLRLRLVQAGAPRVPLNDRLVYLPRTASSLVEGVFTDAGKRFGSIEVRQTQVRRLAPIVAAHGVAPGARFEIAFDLRERTYALAATPSASTPAGADADGVGR